jgi:hypothetical protein
MNMVAKEYSKSNVLAQSAWEDTNGDKKGL